MNGLGFLVWQIDDVPVVDVLIPLLRQVGVRWLSVKIADGVYPFNQTGGNDKVLRDAFIAPLQEAGFEIGGWQYTYGVQPGPEAARAAERIEKLRLDHFLINAEKEYRGTGGKKKAETYMRQLGAETNKKFHVSLCSNRFPMSSWTDFPWGGFLHNEVVKSVTPQVYWMGAHNPAEQLARCQAEYALVTELPVIPIGATFREQGWEPTCEELAAFQGAAMGLQACGYYSLDYALTYRRYDWLTAIAGKTIEPPKPPPATMPDFVRVNTPNGLRLRSEVWGRVIGGVPKGLILPVEEQALDGSGRMWYRNGPAWFAGWLCEEVGS